MENIVSRPVRPGPPHRALWQASRARLRHTLEALSFLVRAEIGVFFATAAILLAIYADESFYAPHPDEPQATTITFASRVLFGVLILSTAAIVQFAPRLIQRGPDRGYLRTAPVPAVVETRWRSDLLALSAVPLFVLGSGLFLSPLQYGEWFSVVTMLFAWLVWLWAGTQCVAWLVTWAPEGRLGPGGLGGFVGRLAHFLAIPLIGAAYFACREVSISLSDSGSTGSMWLTAALGVAIAVVFRWAVGAIANNSDPIQQRLIEHRAILEWKKKSRPQSKAGFALLPAMGTFSTVGAWLAKDLRIALRTPSLRIHWFVVIGLKLLGVALAFTSQTRFPWVFSGLLLVVSDMIAGIAILLQWSSEQPGWTWGSASSRSEQWLAHALPGLVLSLTASGLLAGRAASVADWHTAQVLFLWTVVAGVSLVIAGANLGCAAPPRSALGQNLYGLGLLSTLLVSAVYPVVGWMVLAAFALYTLRSLARDPRP